MDLSIVHFDTLDNDQFINGHGIPAIYYESHVCQCIIDNDGRPLTTCDCDNGVRYYDPIEIILLTTALNIHKNPEYGGLIDHGGTQITIPKTVKNSVTGAYVSSNVWHRVDVNDVIVAVDRKRKVTDILQRTKRDKLVAFNITEILRVLYNNAVVPTAQYTFNTTTKEFSWASAGAESPPVDGKYLVEFIEEVNYRIFGSMPMIRGTRTEDLPKKVVAVHRQYNLERQAVTLTDVEVIK